MIRRYRAAGGVVIHQGRLLLLNRPARGEIRLPKGHIDPGEDALTAALRETREESGYVDLEDIDDLGSRVVEFDYQGDHYVRSEHYFLMGLTGHRQEERDPKDADQFEVLWVDLEQAVALLTYESEQQVASQAVARYLANRDAATGTDR